ncbi:phosphatidylserine/phosphatidylglycerophosphate/cardiolipin synthase family protein [Sphingomonas sp. G-3-2-10]|uniref:phospholipase D-like domain-containing protein n=1 Tax=Sphingomonas sp. G-3-2-10 TaxID=2728838 RepID=UPI00146E451B|nr:phosphatidylserine/phosphatidylglycerophosphate/cardiolipin synthase family protein [Sphingomonas sp. G-3-2-10]NML07184.1 phosphatidylserine/phosphatidylglycerophosphate/cardiolipin synthase family protein [Sphingomonas sp. G-3-2-10]
MADPAPQPSFMVDGNRLRLLTEGPERLAELLDLIRSAQRSLRVLYYIYVDDEAGAAIRQALIDAANRGVAVSLIVDGLGSEHAASRHFFDPLAEAGVDMCRFVPRWGRRYLLRNHQKLALADEERVIIGGFNIESSYFGTADDAAWRDLGLLVEGPAAARLVGYFDALSAWAKNPRPSLRKLGKTLRNWSEPEGPARWLLSGPMRRLSPWTRVIKKDMSLSRSIDLITSYFAPNPAMLRRLDKASKRGRVRLVLPSKVDHTASLWAARFTYAGLLRKRVQIYEYQPTKLHTKLYVIDGVVHIGSANFDIRSLYLNLELMLRVDDPAFAAHVQAYVDGEIANSELITVAVYKSRTGPWTRFRQMIAYFVMAVLDYNVTRRLNFGREGRRR